jgi:hypothetical protein
MVLIVRGLQTETGRLRVAGISLSGMRVAALGKDAMGELMGLAEALHKIVQHDYFAEEARVRQLAMESDPDALAKKAAAGFFDPRHAGVSRKRSRFYDR